MFQERISFLKDQLFKENREISLERALLYTESYQQTEGQSSLLRRAKATSHILENVGISIREKELIAGNRTIKPRSGIVSPEMDPHWIYHELDTIATRPQDPFYISEQDKEIYRTVLYPYWSGRSLKDMINSQLTDEIRKPVSLNIFKLNQTDKGQGHIIMEFQELLINGLARIIAKVENLIAMHPRNDFYEAALIVLTAAQKHILRYASLSETMAAKEVDAARKAELHEICRVSRKVAYEPPANFYEACQLFWYVNVIAQYESNASSISTGRFDQFMYRFFKQDVERGVSLSSLKEILECLWIKMNDVVLIRSEDSAKYFAGFPTGYTIALDGLTSTGRSAVNELSHFILETYQDVLLPQPNLAVRMNELIDRSFLNKTVETIRLGTGIPQIFNDEVIVPGFLNRGVSLEDARDYAIVGCVELTIPGKTYGLHDIALFNLLKTMEITLKEFHGEPNVTYEKIMNGIKASINHYVRLMVEGSNIVDMGHREFAPIPFLSCFIDDCLSKGQDVTYGGARYNFSGVQGIGIANLSDSLYALKKLVFDEKRFSYEELIDALDANFQGQTYEKLRIRLINRYDKYGNDNDEVDDIGSEILRHYAVTVEKYQNIRGGIFTPGSYTVSAHVPLGAAVGATPDGRKAREQLADGGLSPMVGRDRLGPTAILKSVSKLDNYLTTNGSLLNVKFSPKTLEGQEGVNKMANYLLAFMKLKLQHIQFNVISAATLRDAQQHPENYKGLVVRVAGYSAFFTELSEEIQNDIIARTEHVL